jgi:hypothetical protein
MYVDAKWPLDPVLKLVGPPTPKLIVLPRNRAAAAAWSLQTVYDLAAKSRLGLRFNCKNLTSKCASLRFTCNRHPCRLREAAFALDGLLEHDTELDPRVCYTDTHGYTEAVCSALAGQAFRAAAGASAGAGC